MEAKSGQWYSKLKRITNFDQTKTDKLQVDEISHLSDKDQAEAIADSFSAISNEYEAIQPEDFSDYFNPKRGGKSVPSIEPFKVYQTIQKMNQNAATVPDDIPIKLITEFSVELAFPLAHIIDFGLMESIQIS